MDILLVMNPQNSFLTVGGSVYMGEKAEILKVRLVDFLSGFNKPKLFFREKHALEDKFFINDVTHSVTNTSDFAISDSLKKHANEFWDKTRYSAFFDTNLENFLSQKRARHVGIIGVETHTSVLFTAEELRNRGYEVSVVEPCVMSRDDYLHGYAVSLMKNFLGVRIING
jgi:nicotinamidase-related amidase